MPVSSVALTLFRFFLPPAIIATVYLYFYPAINGCAFPPAKRGEAACLIPGSERPAVQGEIAPFRLLALGDPQLEGDTSLPDPNAPAFPSLAHLRRLLSDGGLGGVSSAILPAASAFLADDLPRVFQGYRKQLDLFGNDLYLAHIYRSIFWWTSPTHTVVLGDLLGSQWIDDVEFDKRSRRFWGRVFSGAQRVPKDITASSGRVEVLGDEQWKRRIIAVAGNHDIGYAGDIDEQRIARFESNFGDVNWETSFLLDDPKAKPSYFFSSISSLFPAHRSPELRLVVLNSMNLDQPAYRPDLSDQSREFLSGSKKRSTAGAHNRSATIVLTHVPLYKQAGVCVDPPYFAYFPQHNGGGIREQNHLRRETSETVLDGLGGQGIVLNGHDHEGCDTYHYETSSTDEALASQDSGHAAKSDPSEENGDWEVKRYRLAREERRDQNIKGIREITVRSMMGSFGGNAGLLSAWFDKEAQQWRFEYATCPLGVQHIWWAIHVLVLVEAGLGLTGLCALLLENVSAGQGTASSSRKLKGE